METPKLNLLRRAMQAYTWRIQAHSTNLANLDTPGYERLSVSFEEQLQQELRRGPSAAALHRADPQIQAGDRPPLLEDELMELADTQMRNQLATRALREHFSLLRTGITGRPD